MSQSLYVAVVTASDPVVVAARGAAVAADLAFAEALDVPTYQRRAARDEVDRLQAAAREANASAANVASAVASEAARWLGPAAAA